MDKNCEKCINCDKKMNKIQELNKIIFILKEENQKLEKKIKNILHEFEEYKSNNYDSIDEYFSGVSPQRDDY